MLSDTSHDIICHAISPPMPRTIATLIEPRHFTYDVISSSSSRHFTRPSSLQRHITLFEHRPGHCPPPPPTRMSMSQHHHCATGAGKEGGSCLGTASHASCWGHRDSWLHRKAGELGSSFRFFSSRGLLVVGKPPGLQSQGLPGRTPLARVTRRVAATPLG